MTAPHPDEIAAALSLDPLSEAERATGKSYKDDPATMLLGMLGATVHNAAKEELLTKANDSCFNSTFAEQMALFADLGFEEVYREEFDGTYGPDTFVILWQTDGILATCESHAGTHRNRANVYYNYRHPDGYPGFGLTSSGGMRGGIWVGHHDVREAARHKLNALWAAGEFVSPWAERPFLWLLNYTEEKGDYDYDAINARKIAQMPEPVRLAITPELQSARAEA